MKARHTPGPWRGEDTTLEIVRGFISTDEVRAVQISPLGADVALAYVPTDYREQEQRANAALITAAPDLYGALRGLLAIPGVRDVAARSVVGSIVYAADAAIAKAEGQS